MECVLEVRTFKNAAKSRYRLSKDLEQFDSKKVLHSLICTELCSEYVPL